MAENEREHAYPRLETERLVLRALRMEDTDFILREWGSPVVTLYMRDTAPLQTREEAESWLRPLQDPSSLPTVKWWGIELKAEGALIGTCGYHSWNEEHARAEIGYDLWPDYWGRGLMPEALRVLLRYGFEVMGLNRVEATTHTENEQSMRVLEKLGFRREGVLREYYCQDGVCNDQVLFSLLRREWEERE